MKLKLLVFSALLMAGGNLYAQSKNFVLNGKIKELKDGEQVLLLYRKTKGIDTISSAIVKNGSFTLEGSLANPTFLKLRTLMREEVPLFIENAAMSFTGDSLVLAKLKGSKSNEEYQVIDNSMQQLLNEMRKIGQSAQLAYEQKDQVKIAKIQASIEALQNQRVQLARSYAIANPNSFVSPVIILNTDKFELDPAIYLPIYEKFSLAVKTSVAAKEIKRRCDAMLEIKVGDKAPALAAKTPDGKDLSLAEVLKKGELTLVDFWASWCGPCRDEGAKILKLYKQYHEKGFNVLGVSLDTSEDLWKKAIATDQTDWYHIAELKHSKIADAYGVIKIPAIFLIDKNGKIIAKDPKIKELEQILVEKLNGELSKNLYK
ncbi:TlpA disulfide reductase family protein [Solitalea lacus]|uniref:TlpA disulfide reductase family protein n=1 Tax=Solitalea lacus TaxID=2911172 RepID=UPI001EDB5D98|nr:TlpA disulfide reductase family protein [Solitalea lacus]UKJ08573.1 AhpC/TSA family protein [Solitalea lacus]